MSTPVVVTGPQNSFDWFDSHGRDLNPSKGHDYLEIAMTPVRSLVTCPDRISKTDLPQAGINVIEEPVTDQDFPAFSERLVAAPSDATWRLHVYGYRSRSHDMHSLIR